jgi:hypothetical protein
MNAQPHAVMRSPWRAWLALLLVVVAAACGGGGVDTGGTGATVTSFAAGRISGFGSVIVNDVHYDEAAASIVDDDGVSHRPDELQLGMTVQIEAGPVTRDAAGLSISIASKIIFGTEIRGPIESADTPAGTLRVLGQTVKVDINTVLAGATGVTALRAGDIVQVYAFFDASAGRYTATRIERLAPQASYKLRGPIAHLDTAAKTFTIGGATIAYGSIAPADLPGLQEGVIARVDLQTQMQGGTWVATRIVTGLPGIPPDTAIELEGFVTEFKSLASFKVDGAQVDASGAGVVFDRGTAAQIGNGARLQVDGHMRNGVLMAERIDVRLAAPAKNDPSPPQEPPQQFDVKGKIESVDAAAPAFVVHGTTVFYDTTTSFERGDTGDLKEGRTVQVKGTLSSGHVHAERIKFFK